jgi:hypothetical protein
MASIKSLEQFFDPDPVSFGMGPPLEKQYESLGYFRLHNGVPESVRSYFDSVVMLCLYGWLYYPFYTLASFLSTTAVEMALRERLPKKLDRKGRDLRGLKSLLQTAGKMGLLRDNGFPSLKYRRENSEMMAEAMGEIGDQPPVLPPEVPYVHILVETLPDIRNVLAHPTIHTILTPGMAVDSLILAAEIINQLWAAPESPSAPQELAEGKP